MTRNLNMLRLFGVFALLVWPIGLNKALSQIPNFDTAKPAQSDRLPEEAERQARAVRESCVALASQFKNEGRAIFSKFAIGCVIESKNGQRILAMPFPITEPTIVKGGEKRLSIPVSYLSGTRIVNSGDNQESSNFRERVRKFNSDIRNYPFVEGAASQQTPKSQPASIQQAEDKIRVALLEKREVNFNAVPLSGVLKYFREEFYIPIVMDVHALESALVTPDEPITLELPPVTFQSALNLILAPLNLDYVIENEVLMITSKGVAAKKKAGTQSEPIRVGVVGFERLPSKAMLPFGLYQERYQAEMAGLAPSALLEENGENGNRTIQKSNQDYWAIKGPLVIHQVKNDLGVVLLSFPGDLPAVQIPAIGTEGKLRFVMSENKWVSLPSNSNVEIDAEDGSPIVDEQGSAIGMFVDKKIVTFRSILKSLSDENFDRATLGFWGFDKRSSTPIPTASPTALDSSKKNDQPQSDVLRVSNELPELVSEEMRVQIKKANSLQGEEKVLAMVEVANQLGTRMQMRRKIANEKLETLRLKLQQLSSLTERMKQEDIFEAGKIHPSYLPKLNAGSEDPFSPGYVDNDPFGTSK